MRRLRHSYLPDAAYDPHVTSLKGAFRAPIPVTTDPVTGAAVRDQFRNKNVANSTPVQLVGNDPSVRILPANPRRTGLFLQNKDPTAALYFSFGVSADINSPFLQAGQYILLDFTCPASELYVFATANVILSVTDMTRQG